MDGILEVRQPRNLIELRDHVEKMIARTREEGLDPERSYLHFHTMTLKVQKHSADDANTVVTVEIPRL